MTSGQNPLNADLLDLIPQRPPFVFIDKVMSSDDDKTVTEFHAKAGHVLVDQTVAEGALIENIAQTAAARAGIAIMLAGEEPRVGYIGAIKNLKVHFLPPAGTVLRTEIVPTGTFMNVHVISGVVYAEDKKVAECEMKIFTPEKESE